MGGYTQIEFLVHFSFKLYYKKGHLSTSEISEKIPGFAEFKNMEWTGAGIHWVAGRVAGRVRRKVIRCPGFNLQQ